MRATTRVTESSERFPRTDPHRKHLRPFPAHAGVFPTVICKENPSVTLPRARGGVPDREDCLDDLKDPSPSPRDCGPKPRHGAHNSLVFVYPA